MFLEKVGDCFPGEALGCWRAPARSGGEMRAAGETEPPPPSLGGGGGDDDDRTRVSAPPGLSSAGGGREEGVEVRGEEEGWHRSAAVSVQ